MGKFMGFWGVIFFGFFLSKWVVKSFEFDELFDNRTEVSFLESMSLLESVYGVSAAGAPPYALTVPLTLIQGAAAKGAVCLDGTLPGYHFHRGFGTGANSWLIQLEGGGWCNNIRACAYRKKTRRGSSTYFEKIIPFTGILSNKAQENPDFFNWNRVKIRYCDGASFSGDSENKAAGLQFRGQRIWLAAMEDLMSKGMRYANQATLALLDLSPIVKIVNYHALMYRSGADLHPNGADVRVSDSICDNMNNGNGNCRNGFYQKAKKFQLLD
ncbi:unnamed protein product [Fraxinus pennsylvanica]|uniref:Pectin acetylesterase n=1 Tax=Fraxinus pennsylvanica TaxID=56036 RepID=A0AAD1ZJ00_9LAMI|nr:unnamed protein product [Fraxinus pennsylvanica]